VEKKVLLIVALLFCVSSFAQSHNVRSGSWCKFIKNGSGSVKDESESARCLACAATAKKEEEAKTAQRKRRETILIAKNAADKKAREIEEKKKKAELAEKNKVTEVKLVMPKGAENSSNDSADEDYLNYKVVNEVNLITMSQFKPYNSKILYKGKVVFESNELLHIVKFWRKALFTGSFPRIDDSCKSTYSTNGSYLIDEKMKKVMLEGVPTFHYAKENRNNANLIDITVVTGNCTPILGDRDKNGSWETIEYSYEYKTGKITKLENSAYRTDCGCND
jgi:hypothetical protein